MDMIDTVNVPVGAFAFSSHLSTQDGYKYVQARDLNVYCGQKRVMGVQGLRASVDEDFKVKYLELDILERSDDDPIYELNDSLLNKSLGDLKYTHQDPNTGEVDFIRECGPMILSAALYTEWQPGTMRNKRKVTLMFQN